MFPDLARYPHVIAPFHYSDDSMLLEHLETDVIAPGRAARAGNCRKLTWRTVKGLFVAGRHGPMKNSCSADKTAIDWKQGQ